MTVNDRTISWKGLYIHMLHLIWLVVMNENNVSGQLYTKHNTFNIFHSAFLFVFVIVVVVVGARIRNGNGVSGQINNTGKTENVMMRTTNQ